MHVLICSKKDLWIFFVKSDHGKGRRRFVLYIPVVMSWANHSPCASFLSSGDAKPYVGIVRMLLLVTAVLKRAKSLLRGLDI